MVQLLGGHADTDAYEHRTYARERLLSLADVTCAELGIGAYARVLSGTAEPIPWDCTRRQL